MNKLLSNDSNRLIKSIDNLNTNIQIVFQNSIIHKINSKLEPILNNIQSLEGVKSYNNDKTEIISNLKYSQFSNFSIPKVDKLLEYNYKHNTNQLKIICNTITDVSLVNYLAKITFIFFGFFNIKYFSQKLIIILSNNKKTISKGILGPKNVNSGFTIISSGDIYLYRKEEIVKVLIHELIHSTKKDLNLNVTKVYNRIVNNLFSLDNVLVNESFTEFLACILNAVFNISYYDFIFKTNYINNLDKYIENEIVFSLVQTCKILDHNRIENIYKLDKYREESNIFAYYILKSILLYNIETYIHNIFNINDNNNILFLKTVFSNKKMAIYNRELEVIKKNLIETLPETFIRNNLRMTLYEFNLNALKR